MTKDGFITIPGYALTKLHLSGNTLIVYALIYSYSRRGNGVYISLARIAQTLNMGRNTTVRALAQLLEAGLIQRTETGPRQPVNYCCTPLDQLGDTVPKMGIGYTQNGTTLYPKWDTNNKIIVNNNIYKEKEINKEKEKKPPAPRADPAAAARNTIEAALNAISKIK